MKRIYILIITIIFFNCSNDDSAFEEENLIQSYFPWYMNYPDQILANGDGPDANLIKLEYSQNKIVKRVGDIISVQYLNFSTINQNIYDELSYSNNKIIIEKKSSELEVHPHKRIILLDRHNNIIKKTIHKLGESSNYSDIDTITTQYKYNSKNLLVETYLTKKNNYSTNSFKYYEKAFFYYNQNNNLDSIVTNRYSYNEINMEHEFSQKTVEIFSDYDNSKNPTKELHIFDETFARSLSENNFKAYRKDLYYAPRVLISSSSRTWEYSYDSDGNIRFDK